MNRKRLGKDFLIGISLANLCFLRLWSELLGVKASDEYSMRLPPRPVDLEAAMLNVCLLGGLLCLAATIARRSARGRSLLKWGLTAFLVFPLNAVRVTLTTLFPFLGGAAIRESWQSNAGILIAIGAGSGILGLSLGGKRLLRFAVVTLTILWPLVPITFSRAAFNIARYDPARFADRKLAAPVAVGWPQRRVVWLVFDEMDERMAFVDRQPGLRLPEIDSFREESLWATRAYSPARHTLESMPALITGRQVVSARALGPDDLLLNFGAGSPAHFQREKNVFSRARDAGFDTAAAGWYHSYCRVLNQSLTGCEWSEFDFSSQSNSRGEQVPEVAVNQLRSLLETSTLSPFGQSLATIHHVRIYQEVLTAGSAFAADPRFGLVLIHFPIPHRPYIYQPQSGRLDAANSPGSGYDDALVLADRTLGQMRQAMQDQGVWDRTAVLISSDHGYRVSSTGEGGRSERWVPFLLRLPGQHQYRQYDRPVETVWTADLLLQILQNHIQTPADASAWLDESAGRFAESAFSGKAYHRGDSPADEADR